MDFSSSVTEIKGIGNKTAENYEKIGVYTVRDILLHFPRDYQRMPRVSSLAEAKEGETVALFLRIKKAPFTRKGARMSVTVVDGFDGEVPVELVWFRVAYIGKMLKSGFSYVFYGKIKKEKNKWKMEQPAIYEKEAYQAEENRLLPVYGLTKGLTNRQLRKDLEKIFRDPDCPFADYLDAEQKKRLQLMNYRNALHDIHFPELEEDLVDARKRLVFDEFFLFLLSMQFLKEKGEKKENGFTFRDRDFVYSHMEKLPFTLTNSQKKVVEEVLSDMEGDSRMQRLIQGDVGSGKTILAFLFMIYAAHNGYQSAIMAPTEVLAEQHYKTFCQWKEVFQLPFPVVLLTGSMKAKERREALEIMKTREDALIVGTHALIQEKADFCKLALVVTDEQHRFGVKQREVFSQKGQDPHILVMSATPIPRTLAIILYGDLDISVIDEVPAKRLPIKNCVVGTSYRKTAYQFMQKEIQAGHQVYIICPFVEESEAIDGENVTDYCEKIRPYFPDSIKMGILHGKMKGAEKQAVMDAFAANEIQILISTTVVEVGVNVPNATVMMVENAERFGLAQLHQLRGRVGRGDAQSYCIFMNGKEADEKNKRLEILNKSNDGFYIASEDLKLRGPGDFLGIRQSGALGFALADVYQDADMLQVAYKECQRILEEDPELQNAKYSLLRYKLHAEMKRQMEFMNI